MKKIFLFLLVGFFLFPYQLYSAKLNYFDLLKKDTSNICNSLGKKVSYFGDTKSCEGYTQEDIPTIFIPGILASWYSEEGFEESEVKRWIPDPIAHSYDTLIYTFRENEYDIKDVFYEDQFNVSIDEGLYSGNPKKSLYIFGYDWKKDNKITATLLTQLIGKILKQYERANGYNIGQVNIVSHSMGGLVARAMLEDMCADHSYAQGKLTINEYTETTKNGLLKDYTSVSCKNPFSSNTISENISLNKFITLSTPHRGSPKSFALWEKGDLERVEADVPALLLKKQLDSTFDSGLYEVIHGYESGIPNGMVTIGQLLPDIEEDNSYNERLKYLYKRGELNASNSLVHLDREYPLEREEHPRNTFLEDLNKKKNIDKIWEKVKGSYTSYYSLQTGNNDDNNIIGYNLSPYFTEGNNEYYKKETIPVSKDIYSHYSKDLSDDYYLINNIVQNEEGLGGDGTVPSLNLKLVPNDSETGEEIEHEKFESREIKCYSTENPSMLIPELLNEYQSSVYNNIGDKSELEVCAHSLTPIASSLEIYEEISGNTLTLDSSGKYSWKLARKLLLSNIGYAKYNGTYTLENGFLPFLIGSTYEAGIHNTTRLDSLFHNTKYNKVLSDEDLLEEYFRIDNKPNVKPEVVSLDFEGKLGSLNRLARYDILSPINLLITDDQGRSIGIDPDTGRIINEIPGAWTSGNTEGSGEPEFFLIPISGSGANHEIKTYGTGDGEYHIVMNEIETSPQVSQDNLTPTLSLEEREQNKKEPQGFIIAGTAKTNYGEDYEVEIADTGVEYVNITEATPTTLEVSEQTITTDQSNLDIRYTVRGNATNVEKIQYTFGGETKTTTINGKLTLNLPQETTYTLNLQLLDQNNHPLTNPESQQTIQITKIKKQPTITQTIQQSSNNQNTSSFTLEEEQREGVVSFIYKKETPINLQIQTTQVQEGSLGYQLTHNYDTLENQPEDLEYIYKKNDRGDDVLDYVTDNETNTLFFEYQDDVIKQIKDLSNNIITFEYSSIENTPFLTDIKIQNTVNQKPIENIQVEYSEDLEPQVKIDTIELQTTPNNNSPSLLGRGLGGGIVQYSQGQDGNLYSILGNKIYQINQKTKKRKPIFTSLSQREYPRNEGEGLSNIFVTKQGTIYFTDQQKKLHKYSNKKLFLYDTQIPGSFVIKQGKVYFLDPFKKQYTIYNLETQELQKVDTKIFYIDIGIKNDEIILIDEEHEQGNNQDHPEFGMKYEKKLQKLQEKLKFAYTKEVKEKLRRAIEKSKTKFLTRIKDEYIKIEMNYLIGRILDLLG